MKDLISKILSIILGIVFIMFVVSSIKQEIEFKENVSRSMWGLWDAFCLLKDRVEGENHLMKPLLIPNYMNQSTYIVVPNGSAYIPLVYKNKDELPQEARMKIKDMTNEDWTSNNIGYFDMKSIYRPRE